MERVENPSGKNLVGSCSVDDKKNDEDKALTILTMGDDGLEEVRISQLNLNKVAAMDFIMKMRDLLLTEVADF